MPIGKVETQDRPLLLVTNGEPAQYARQADEKSVRILRQGVYQAALNSPGIAGLPYKNEDEYVKLVASVAEKVIKLIEG